MDKYIHSVMPWSLRSYSERNFGRASTPAPDKHVVCFVAYHCKAFRILV